MIRVLLSWGVPVAPPERLNHASQSKDGFLHLLLGLRNHPVIHTRGANGQRSETASARKKGREMTVAGLSSNNIKRGVIAKEGSRSRVARFPSVLVLT
jgi:hypothetical protein